MKSILKVGLWVFLSISMPPHTINASLAPLASHNPELFNEFMSKLEKGELTEEQIKANINIQDQTGHFSKGWTPLRSAVNAGNLELVQKLIALGARIDLADNNGKTPLMDACMLNCPEVTKALLEAPESKKYINQADNEGRTALMWTVYYAYYASPTCRSPEKYTPEAIIQDRVLTLQMIIDAGAHVDAVDKNGFTALMHATATGKKDLVKPLIDAGADIVSKNIYNRSALDIAELRLAQLTLEDQEGWPADIKETQEIVELLKKGRDLQLQKSPWLRRWLALKSSVSTMFMADNKLPVDIRLFLDISEEGIISDQEIKANMNKHNILGQTPLIYAAQKGRIAAVKKLLSLGADTTIKDNKGNTALIYACGNFFPDIAQLIINADIQARRMRTAHYGLTQRDMSELKLEMSKALIWAMSDSYSLSFGFNREAIAQEKERRQKNRPLIARMLAYADPNYKDEYGNTAFTIAIMTFFGDIESIRILLEKGADVNQDVDSLGRSALLYAIREYGEHPDSLALIKLLLDYGADMDQQANAGYSAWEWVQEGTDAKTVTIRELLQKYQ